MKKLFDFLLYPVYFFMDYLNMRKYYKGVYIKFLNYPCIITKREDSWVTAIRLTDNSTGSCGDLFQSDMEIISKEEAENMVNIFKDGGEVALLMHSGYTKEWAESFVKDWRNI